MFRKAAIAAVALVGASLTEAAKLQEISKRDGAHGHDHAHAAPAAPASAYVPPASSYSAPASSYGAPAASYGAPAPSYGAPAPSYEEPAPSYGAPSYGAPAYEVEEQPGFFPDVTFIIVGILIVIGLSLLFPTYVSLTTVRRKRDTAEAAVAAATVIAHEHEHDHTVVKRDKSDYSKVNRDSEYGAPQAPSFTSSGSTYAAPSTSYSAPAPAPTYSAPAPSYSAPAPSYSSPVASASYSAPSSSYGAPVSYGTSDVSYGSTGYGDEGGKGIDLTAILIPLLALIGLSLLFPTYVSLTTVRKRRSADDPKEINPTNSLLERVSDIYNSVVQSESCMERIACEIGGITSDMGVRETVKIADPFVPSKYKAYFKQFHSGVNCNKIKCGSLAF